VLRSAIDAAIDAARSLASNAVFPLPAFAGWSRDEWLGQVDRLGPTISRGLGWDVTDFGRGDFARYGLCLCTIRNGRVSDVHDTTAQTYAEKFMVVEVGQETPFHLHPRKTEDIINRGGGVLHVEVYPADGGRLGDGVTTTFVDGIETVVAAGEAVIVCPGQSIQIPSGAFHRFWAVDARVLGGEVSATNDDDSDNIFLESFPRYASIEEDAPARYLLVGEYAAILGSSRN
jgi:D-lyxose ketol-isomerase